MCERRKEEIYEIKGKIVIDEELIPIHLINYESLIIDSLIEYGLDIEETNWLDYIDEHEMSISVYPYYIENSEETIQIKSSMSDKIYTRPLMVEGMGRHTTEQLQELRSRDVFTLHEVAKIEKWKGNLDKLR